MNEQSHITTVADVKAFFHHLVDERKVNFRLMEESFDVCEAAGVDIYELGLEELETVLKPAEA